MASLFGLAIQGWSGKITHVELRAKSRMTACATTHGGRRKGLEQFPPFSSDYTLSPAREWQGIFVSLKYPACTAERNKQTHGQARRIAPKGYFLADQDQGISGLGFGFSGQLVGLASALTRPVETA